jgi:O-antigen/teichoic acid export membrane protein
MLLVFPIALGCVFFAEEGLTAWLGAEFARESAAAAKWLTAGVFVNSIALVPFTLLQGGGRPDLTAKLHLSELPVYIAGLWWLTARFGIEGAAAMWTLRAIGDAWLLFWLGARVFPPAAGAVRQVFAGTTAGLGALALAARGAPLWVEIALWLLLLAGTILLAWRKLGARRRTSPLDGRS